MSCPVSTSPPLKRVAVKRKRFDLLNKHSPDWGDNPSQALAQVPEGTGSSTSSFYHESLERDPASQDPGYSSSSGSRVVASLPRSNAPGLILSSLTLT
ncbi:unnamed protein product [Caretta caretta]